MDPSFSMEADPAPDRPMQMEASTSDNMAMDESRGEATMAVDTSDHDDVEMAGVEADDEEDEMDVRASNAPHDSSNDAHSENGDDSDSDDDILRLPMSALDDLLADDEVEGQAFHGPPKTENELLVQDLPPPESHHASPRVTQDDLMLVGKISSIVDSMVVVESRADTKALDTDSWLWLRADLALGKVFDVFGQVSQPFYAIRINPQDNAVVSSIAMGSSVFCAPTVDSTQFVFAERVRKSQPVGCDASWRYDEEPPAGEEDFSDDEREREMRAQAKKAKKQSKRRPATQTTTTTTATSSPSASLSASSVLTLFASAPAPSTTSPATTLTSSMAGLHSLAQYSDSEGDST